MRGIVAAIMMLTGLWSGLAASRVKVNAGVLHWARANPEVIPIIVRMDVDGTLDGSICVRLGRQELLKPISVGTGRFRFEIPFYHNEFTAGAVEVLLRDKRGRPIDRQYVPVNSTRYSTDTKRTCGWITGRRQHQQIREIAVGPIQDRMLSEQGNPGFSYLVLPITELATDWRMYLNFDAIIVSNGGGERMQIPEVKALRRWVESGGRLVIASNASQMANCEFVKAFSDCPESVQSCGIGGVFRSDRDFSMLAKKSSRGFREAIPTNALFVPTKRGQFDRRVNNWPTSNINQPAIMAWWVGLENISTHVILIMMGVFVLLVTVLERGVLRLFKRRYHLTWIITPILIVLFCYLATKLSSISRGMCSRQTVIDICDYGINGRGLLRSENCIIPSSGRQQPVSFAPNGLMFCGGTDNDSTFILDQGEYSSGSQAWTPYTVSGIATIEQHPTPIVFNLSDQLKLGTQALPADWHGKHAYLYHAGIYYEGDMQPNALWSKSPLHISYSRHVPVPIPAGIFRFFEAPRFRPELTGEMQQAMGYYEDNRYLLGSLISHLITDTPCSSAMDDTIRNPVFLGPNDGLLIRIAEEPEHAVLTRRRRTKSITIIRQVVRIRKGEE